MRKKQLDCVVSGWCVVYRSTFPDVTYFCPFHVASFNPLSSPLRFLATVWLFLSKKSVPRPSGVDGLSVLTWVAWKLVGSLDYYQEHVCVVPTRKSHDLGYVDNPVLVQVNLIVSSFSTRSLFMATGGSAYTNFGVAFLVVFDSKSVTPKQRWDVVVWSLCKLGQQRTWWQPPNTFWDT